MRKHKTDIIVVLILIAITISIWGMISLFYKKTGSYLEISIDEKVWKVVHLKQNATYKIPVMDGTNILVVNNGKAYMKDADCSDKLCVRQGTISANGETIICLPHKIVVRVISDKEKKWMIMQNNLFYKKISLLALFIAFATVLSYLESFLPVIWIPGVKLGLANFAVVLALFLLGAKEALIINTLRIIMIGAMFGNLFGIWFSISGAFISFLAMLVAKKTKRLSIITIAILGGVFHNIGQSIAAFLVVGNYAVYVYLPVLMIAGIVTGAIIGILSKIVYDRVGKLLAHIENK